MISHNEVVRLLAMAAGNDQRTVGEHDIELWKAIAQIEHWTYATAVRVLIGYYARNADKPRITPAAISDGIRKARSAAAESFRVPDVPEGLLASDYPRWYREHLHRHIDEQLEGWAAGRELTAGPSTPSSGPLPIGAAPEHLREQIARDIERIGSMPRPAVEQTLPHGVALDPHRRAEARAELDARRPAEAPPVVVDEPTGTDS